MKKNILAAVFIAVTALALTTLVVNGCSKQNTKAITQELANDMTDEMTFDNGQVSSGPPPAEHKGEAGYPQSTIKSSPSTLLLGQQFTIQLKQTDASSSDGGNAAASIATGAVVYVTPATKYITVTATVDAQGVMTLYGQIAFDAELTDVEAKVSIAMKRSDGGVGNYSEWNLSLKVTDFDCVNYCEITAPCNPYMEQCVPYCNVFYHYIQQGFLDTAASCIPDVKSCDQLSTCENEANQKCSRDATADGALNIYCQAFANCDQITVSECLANWYDGPGAFSDCFTVDFWNLMKSCTESLKNDCENFNSKWQTCMGWPKNNN